MNQEEKNKHMYANSTGIRLGRFDITLALGHEIDNHIHESIVVSMSPQHAKAMNELLSASLQEYEEVFGQINIEERNNSTK